MRKFEMDHLKGRVDSVVKCTNGSVSTKLNKLKKDTGITDETKYEMIKASAATVRSHYDLYKDSAYRTNTLLHYLLKCFDYPITKEQQKKIDFNIQITNRIDEIHHEIELEGKRLIDRAVLGIIEAAAIPDELLKLGEMVSLTNR